MKKIGMFLIISLLLFPNLVKAQDYNGQIKKGTKIKGIYIKKEKGDQKRREYAQFLYRTSDGKAVYCLEPWAKINNDSPYHEALDNYHLILNLSKDDFRKIELYAYYGYQYQNHTEDKWYLIAQKKIWQVVDKDMDIYFTDQLIDGNRIDPYQKEEQELENLVLNHLKKPSFDGKTYTVNYHDNITITDTNKVLTNFDNQNSNTITLNNLENDNLYTFKKEDKRFNTPPVLYYQENSQNVFYLGKPETVEASFKIHVTKGRIKITKKDMDTLTPLKDVVFEVYKDNKLITTLTTDSEGSVLSSYLPLGTYKIKEVKTNDNYILDTKEYTVTLDKDDMVKNLNITNKKRPVLPKTSGRKNYSYLLPILLIWGIKKKYEI